MYLVYPNYHQITTTCVTIIARVVEGNEFGVIYRVFPIGKIDSQQNYGHKGLTDPISLWYNTIKVLGNTVYSRVPCRPHPLREA